LLILPPKKKSLGWLFLSCQQIWITKVVSTFSRALNLIGEGRLAVSNCSFFFLSFSSTVL